MNLFSTGLPVIMTEYKNGNQNKQFMTAVEKEAKKSGINLMRNQTKADNDPD